MTKVQRRIKQIEAEKATEKDIITLFTVGIYTVIFISFIWLILAM